jgi:hypothetical protein
VSVDDGGAHEGKSDSRRSRATDERGRRRPMERLGELLPKTARRLGLDEPLELAAAMTAWQHIIAERVPEADGSCRLVSLGQGVAIVETDAPTSHHPPPRIIATANMTCPSANPDAGHSP